MAAIVRVARDPVLFRLMLGVLAGLVSFEGTRVLIDLFGGPVP